jgi:formyltetrahydrofolate hydrolase
MTASAIPQTAVLRLLCPDRPGRVARVSGLLYELGANILAAWPRTIAGADPYRRAYRRGVKLIGATSHYVTTDLDEGPIIAQEVTPVSHRDTVEDMERKAASSRSASSPAPCAATSRRGSSPTATGPWSSIERRSPGPAVRLA